ncbi:carboxymuconolactone decarboxylase family protein [Gymnodinialimonas hymeniacidonis]|uniref:carboxymuconolactone decarboxylase family protein n=1 Tax=Gymnodinialimonas hymeniacidonis TaxID=3126508 RepID=UPI0034C63C65
MTHRLDYVAINGPAIQSMLAAKRHMPSIDVGFRALLELRVSQINGCTYCIDLHTKEAKASGEAPARLGALPEWRGNTLFSAREQAALAWAESLTRVETDGAPDVLYDALLAHFSEKEVVDLTLIIAQMNAWNRLAIGFEKPEIATT